MLCFKNAWKLIHKLNSFMSIVCIQVVVSMSTNFESPRNMIWNKLQKSSILHGCYMHNLLTLVSYAGKDCFIKRYVYELSIFRLRKCNQCGLNATYCRARRKEHIAKPVTYHHHRRLVSMSDSTNDK